MIGIAMDPERRKQMQPSPLANPIQAPRPQKLENMTGSAGSAIATSIVDKGITKGIDAAKEQEGLKAAATEGAIAAGPYALAALAAGKLFGLYNEGGKVDDLYTDPFADYFSEGGQAGFRSAPTAPTVAEVAPIYTPNYGSDFIPELAVPENIPMATAIIEQNTQEPSGDEDYINPALASYKPGNYYGDYSMNLPPFPGTSTIFSALSGDIQKKAVEDGSGITFTNPAGRPVTVHEGLGGGLVITGQKGGVPDDVYYQAYRDSKADAYYPTSVPETTETPPQVAYSGPGDNVYDESGYDRDDFSAGQFMGNDPDTGAAVFKSSIY